MIDLSFAAFTTPAALAMGAMGVGFGILLDALILRPLVNAWVLRVRRDDGR